MSEMPRWGRVVAQPHEFLVQIRGGRVRRSGQGASCFKRIVAGLTLDECLTHRKERVAGALMQEIAPVLAGEGSLADGTSTGWGVILDTIEIQDVKVLSQEVFSRLQAPYREALALEALSARERVLREEARLEAERRRVAEQAKRDLMAEEEARMAAERKREDEARRHKDLLADRAQEAELARLLARTEAEAARAAIDLEGKRKAGELASDLERMRRSALTDLSEARLNELMMTETMPAIANAFRGSFDRVNLSSGDGGNLFAFLSAGMEQVMDVARRPVRRS